MAPSLWLPWVLTALLAAPAYARIKLITLPVRERVEIQLDHESATLVEEERIVPLVKGENQVDFSWAGTAIDPDTIVFRVIGPGGADGGKQPEAKVLSVSYPPGEQALVWAVGASDSGSTRVRISYLLGQLSKSFNYRAVASRDETTLALSQYMRLQNFANEEFTGGSTNLWAGFGKEFLKPVGLNETKEMLVSRTPDVPVRKTYTCDVSEFGYLDAPQKKLRVPMHYVIRNDKASKLGAAPLRDGKVRIFIQGGGGGGGNEPASADNAFLGEDWGKFTPVDDEMRLYLGVAQDVVVRRTIERNVSHRVAANVYNYEVVVKFEIENRKDRPVRLGVGEHLKNLRAEVGHANDRDVQCELRDGHDLGDYDAEKGTHEKLLFHVDLPARAADGKAETVVKKLHVLFKNEW